MLVKFNKDYKGKKKGDKINIKSIFAKELIKQGIVEEIKEDKPEIKKVITNGKSSSKKSNKLD